MRALNTLSFYPVVLLSGLVLLVTRVFGWSCLVACQLIGALTLAGELRLSGWIVASLRGAKFFGGLIKNQGWMKRYMDKVKIPDSLQTSVIRVFMDLMAEESLKLQEARSGFVVVDTRKTLRGQSDWLNEIHPNREGFKAIATRIYKKMESNFPALVHS